MGQTEKTIPEKLESFRLVNRFSQGFMGDLTGVSQQVYSNIEKGKNQKYDPDFLVKMNNLLNGRLDDEQKKLVLDKKGEDFTINIVGLAAEMKKPPTPNAFPLGSIDDEVTEVTKSGNEFIDLGSGNYAMLVPIVHEYAYGGYLLGFRDPEYIETLPKHSIVVNEKHKGIYRTFIMRGDSMDNGERDSIEPGDKVTGRLISKQYWTSKLHIRKYKEFIIHHKAGILIKEIIAHNVEKGIITIHARNPDKVSYPDEEIYLAEVEEIYNVVEVSKPRK